MSRLEVALGAVMEGFGTTNEKSEEKFLDYEKNKLEVEKKRIEHEMAKLESEERQKGEERQHQFNMMNLIMGMVSGQRPPGLNLSALSPQKLEAQDLCATCPPLQVPLMLYPLQRPGKTCHQTKTVPVALVMHLTIYYRC